MLRALSVMSARVLFWLRPRCRQPFLLSLASLRRAIFLVFGVGGAPHLLYALLTSFHASDHPSVRFAAARLRGARTARLVGVFAGVGVFRHERCRVFGARGVVLGRFARAGTVGVRYWRSVRRVCCLACGSVRVGAGKMGWVRCSDGWNCEVRVRAA